MLNIDSILDSAMAAYGQTKTTRVDRNRLRQAIKSAVEIAYSQGYRDGFAAAEYTDTGTLR